METTEKIVCNGNSIKVLNHQQTAPESPSTVNPSVQILSSPPIPSICFNRYPHQQMQACIVLPVKDESECLVATLEALRKQTDDAGNSLPADVYEILLLANNCSDDSYRIALRYQQQYPEFKLYIAEIELDKKHANIGTVRRMLMDEAYRRHQYNNRNGIIVSTDSDTEVDAKWLYHIFSEINKGSEAVGGRIITRHVQCDSRLYHLQDVTYRYLSARLEAEIDPCIYDPWPNHFQYFGASMAVLCSAYEKAGRLPVLPFLEDEEFRKALYRFDVRVRRSPAVKVYTSSRFNGRVAFGFSVYLQQLADMKKQAITRCVESPEWLIIRWQCKRQLRICWQAYQTSSSLLNYTNEIAATLGLNVHWLYSEIKKAKYFGELWEKTELHMQSGKWSKMHKPVPITEAISALRKYFAD